MRTTTSRLALLGGGLLLASALTACSGSDDAASGRSSSSPAASSTAASTTAASSAPASGTSGTPAAGASDVHLHDAWVRATDSDMTAVFGTIGNHGTTEVHIVSASSPLTGTVQLHETVSGGGGMSMREAAGGFRIPAGGEFALTPGGNHVMLMGLRAPITTGQQVQVTLRTEDGREIPFTASARATASGNESYQGGTGMSGTGTTGMPGMDHDSSSPGMPGMAPSAMDHGADHTHG